MNFKYKYALITQIKKKIETYFGNTVKELEEYAGFREFTEYKIFELKEV